MMKGFLLSIAIFSLVFPCGVAVAADGPQDTATEIQVSPVRFDWTTLSAGEEREGVLNLKNYAEDEYRIIISTENFYISDDSSSIQFFSDQDKERLVAYDVVNWIRPEETEFVMKGGEVRTLKFKVSVPEKAPTGGYYGALLVEHQKINKEKVEGAAILEVKTRVGVLMIMGVDGIGPVVQKAELKNFYPEKKIFFEDKKDASVIAEVFNSGNIPFQMGGEAELFRFGKLVKTMPLDARIAYPEKTRTYLGSWDFGLFDIGMYEAKLKLISDNEKIKLNGETTFWIIPWKLIAIIAGIIFFLWLVYKSGQHKGKKKNNSSEKE